MQALIATRALIGYRNQIAERAIKDRLPLISEGSDFVIVGGLMLYAANDPENYRRAAVYVEQNFKKRETRRLAGRAADQVRARDQFENCQRDPINNSAECAGARGSSDQVTLGNRSQAMTRSKNTRLFNLFLCASSQPRKSA